MKNKFKLGLGWAPQNGSPKLFYSFNLINVLQFQSVEMNFHELFLKPILKMWFNGLSFIPKGIVKKELWLYSFGTKTQKKKKLF